jgi:hypothetical protein
MQTCKVAFYQILILASVFTMIFLVFVATLPIDKVKRLLALSIDQQTLAYFHQTALFGCSLEKVFRWIIL